MEIAVLAWGSLVWQPANDHGELVTRPGSSWSDDGPMLPVEFARISSDGRLTLVIMPGYPSQSRVLWRHSGFDDLDAAIGNLAARETGAPRSAIHALTASGRVHGEPAEATVDAIDDWLPSIGVDAAIWTGLSPGERWQEHGHDGFSPQAAAEYVSSLTGPQRARALEYVRNAPAQVDTPVRRALAHLLGA